MGSHRAARSRRNGCKFRKVGHAWKSINGVTCQLGSRPFPKQEGASAPKVNRFYIERRWILPPVSRSDQQIKTVLSWMH